MTIVSMRDAGAVSKKRHGAEIHRTRSSVPKGIPGDTVFKSTVLKHGTRIRRPPKDTANRLYETDKMVFSTLSVVWRTTPAATIYRE
jgi:hypothetical protein